MTSPPTNYADRLLDALLNVPALNDALTGPANRSMLLRRLPAGPVATIPRFPAVMTDLASIVRYAEGMGQLLDSGEWALAIVTRNALRLAQAAQPARTLQELLAEFETRSTAQPPAPVPEIVIGQDERLPVQFLERGLNVARSVAKVLVSRVENGQKRAGSGGRGSGTGWMIAPGLLMTNHHVIDCRAQEPHASPADFQAQAATAEVWFDYQDDDREHVDYTGWELVHADVSLDYALLRLTKEPSKARVPLADWGFLAVEPNRLSFRRGARLNIIQHPQGGPKRIAIRSNFYFDEDSAPGQLARLRYLTDTEPGSSGSPVFGDDWRVVALHQASVQVPEATYRGEVVKFTNQGISLHAILNDLPAPIRQEIQTAQQGLAPNRG